MLLLVGWLPDHHHYAVVVAAAAAIGCTGLVATMAVGTSSEGSHTGSVPDTIVCSTIAVGEDLLLLLLHHHHHPAVEEAGVPTGPAASRSTAATRLTSRASLRNRSWSCRTLPEKTLSLAQTVLHALPS